LKLKKSEVRTSAANSNKTGEGLVLVLNTLSHMKKNSFRSNKKYFHVSLQYQTAGLLKNLDWVFIQKNVNDMAHIYEIEIQALVMMDTHLHILISNFENKENFFCENLQNKICKTDIFENLSEPIMNYSQYLNTYRYIYRNPVEAGLCKKAEDYPYSSLYCLLGKGAMHCEVYDHLSLIQNPLHVLKWLNHDIDYKISQLKLLREASLR